MINFKKLLSLSVAQAVEKRTGTGRKKIINKIARHPTCSYTQAQENKKIYK